MRIRTLADLGGMIREERENRCLSQEALGNMTGVSRWTIIHIEKGENVASEAVLAVLEALEIVLDAELPPAPDSAPGPR